MIFTFIFFIFLLLSIFIFSKKKNSPDIIVILSFLLGIFQTIFLFLIFFLVFYSERNEVYNINYNYIAFTFTLEFIFLTFFLLLVFISNKNTHILKSFKTIVTNLFQIFFPVILLNFLLIFVFNLNLVENGYVYLRMVQKFFFLIVFKICYIFSSLFFIKEFNDD